MYISRIVVRNFRNITNLDLPIQAGVTSIVGENNTGKTNLLHAIRLVLDADLPGYSRQLTLADVNESVAKDTPFQVLASIELKGFEHDINASAFAAFLKVDEDLARLTYRFRPSAAVRDALDAKERRIDDLSLDDYRWEITGGGDTDPAIVEWSDDCGNSIRISDLSDYLVVFLHALRDVVTDLRTSRSSPLRRIIRSLKLSRTEQDRLVGILQKANLDISSTKTIEDLGDLLSESLSSTAGEAFDLDVELGMSTPTFASIERNLTLLLSSDTHEDFEPSQNGLGINNVLYVALLLQYVKSRLSTSEFAGSLILLEEPEAHLHPQLQRVLLSTLKNQDAQVIVTTHSTHITAAGGINDFVVLSVTNEGQIYGNVPSCSEILTDRDRSDLERYLDATKSTLLFARRVILVEGPAELFLLSEMARHVCKVDLDRRGIVVVPIFGTHFSAFAKLFGPTGIRKRCAIITDRDGVPAEDGAPPRGLVVLENEFVKVFSCDTTLERELAIPGMLVPLRATATDLRAVSLRQALRATPPDMGEIAERTLSAAENCSKGRFAQVLSKYIHQATEIPLYLRQAIGWISE